MGASTLNKKELFRLHMGEVKDDYATLMGDCEYYESQIESLQNENERLRELADAVKEFVEDTHCEDCPCRRDCDDNNRIFCANDFSYNAFAAMRELRIEVGNA